MIDVVSGSIILNRKSFHNVTLPLSWLNGLLRIMKLDLNVKAQDIVSMARIFVKDLGKLIENLQTGDPQLGTNEENSRLTWGLRLPCSPYIVRKIQPPTPGHLSEHLHWSAVRI